MARQVALAGVVAVVVACALTISTTSLYAAPSSVAAPYAAPSTVARPTVTSAPRSLNGPVMSAVEHRSTEVVIFPTKAGSPPGTSFWAAGGLLTCCVAMAAGAVSMLQKVSTKVATVDVDTVLLHSSRTAGGLVLSAALASSAMAASLTYDEMQSLFYMEMKGSGLSNQCPLLADNDLPQLNLQPGNYKVEGLCLEPSSFQVKLPSDGKTVTDFEKTKLMTRLTYTLDGIRADLKVDDAGSWTLKEKDGLDYAATTVKLAGGESVPFLFTIRNLEAHGTAGQLIGEFEVPSYRGATFMDPRSRGGATGYDYQQGLQAAGDQEEYQKENIKNLTPQSGTIALKVARADADTGEVAGVFESIQASDNDMGAKASKEVKASGVWYARISPA